MSDLVERLETTGAERQRTTAHDNPDHYLHVVAKISQADGLLMKEAAAEIERLREALRPFAEQAERYFEPDSQDEPGAYTAWDSVFTVEQLRRAAAALGDPHDKG